MLLFIVLIKYHILMIKLKVKKNPILYLYVVYVKCNS